MNRSDRAFAMHKAPHIAEAIAKNMRHLDPARSVVRCAGEYEYEDAVVIGAGHTMPAEIPDDGRVLSIAVNSALGALAHRGYTPSHLLCRESIDMSDTILRASKKWTRGVTAILDVGTHQNTWAACEAVCSRVLWFVPASTQTFWLAAHTGIAPVYGGTSNVTASVEVARIVGARSISLLGCSRAFSATGRAYASGSDWESVRLLDVEQMGDHLVGTIGGLEEKERLHQLSGQRPPLRRERVVELAGVNGERLMALEPLEGDRSWLVQFAARHGHEIHLRQRDPDVMIDGWSGDPRPATGPAELQRWDGGAVEVARQVEHARAMAAAILEGRPVVDVDGLVEGSPLVDYAGIGDRLRVLDALRGKGPVATTSAVYRACLLSADAVEGWAR